MFQNCYSYMTKHVNVFDLMLKGVVRNRGEVFAFQQMTINWGFANSQKREATVRQHTILFAYFYYLALTGQKANLCGKLAAGLSISGTLRKEGLFNLLYIINNFYFNRRRTFSLGCCNGTATFAIKRLEFMPGVVNNMETFFFVEDSRMYVSLVSNCKSNINMKVLLSSLRLFLI